MHRPLSILVIGRATQVLSPIVERLRGHQGLDLATRILSNGQTITLGEEAPPDALILAVGADWRDALPMLVGSLPAVRPPFVVVGPDSDVDFLKAAMRAGARDAVTVQIVPEEFVSALARMADEERLRTGTPTSRIIAFMNSKGGSGATFIAANVAAALSTMRLGRTLVLDMDFQFGSLPTYVDLPATNGLIKALEFAGTLDEAALQGYVQNYKTGLQVLAAAMDDIILPEDVSEGRVKQLLATVDGIYRNIVVDLPRRIDGSTAATLAQADEIVVVTQQTLSHLHDTKRLMYLLQNQLGIMPDRLRLVVNRYDKNADIRVEDFSMVLVGISVETLPGDFRRVAQSINVGEPLVLGSPRSPLGRELIDLATSVASGSPQPPTRSPGLRSWLSRSK
jgi:pilus assembly protein CpaE